MIDNRTGSCKASYTYAVIHKYNRTDVQAKPGMHIQLFTDTIELVYMQSQVHIYTYLEKQLQLVYQNACSYSVIYVYNAAGPSTMKMNLIHCDINASTCIV